MKFVIDNNLLRQARSVLSKRKELYWIVGGAGSGKTTISRVLAKKLNIPLYDMDKHIYGDYHTRFTQERHPVNKAWSMAENSLAWMLDMSWEKFNNFNQAALPEYIDLLVEDIKEMEVDTGVLIDGGISNPALIAQVIPGDQIVCLVASGQSSVEVWEANEERKAMKKMIYRLPEPEKAWQKFLEFDRRITRMILEECELNDIPVCVRNGTEMVEELSERVVQILGLQ